MDQHHLATDRFAHEINPPVRPCTAGTAGMVRRVVEAAMQGWAVIDTEQSAVYARAIYFYTS